jgi:hypothetical protein
VGPLNIENRIEPSARPLNTILEFGAVACRAGGRTSVTSMPWSATRCLGLAVARSREKTKFPCQQPDGGAGDTPGVAAAPVALAGPIVPGVVSFIVMLSAHAGAFGVGTTVIVGSMLVVASSVTEG